MTTTASERDYQAGLDLARQMLQLGEHAAGPDNKIWWALEEEIRGSHPHDNWAFAFIQRLIAQPELAQGFAAALSDFLPTAYV